MLRLRSSGINMTEGQPLKLPVLHTALSDMDTEGHAIYKNHLSAAY